MGGLTRTGKCEAELLRLKKYVVRQQKDRHNVHHWGRWQDCTIRACVRARRMRKGYSQ